MAKEDFCFTYYDGDAARDKAHMNRLERGAYDDLISAQRKRGHLSYNDIKKVLGSDFENCWSSMEWVLKKDDHEKYFIEWVDTSIDKMKKNAARQKEKIQNYWDKKKKEDDTTVIPRNNNGIGSEEPLESGNENEDGNGKKTKGVQGEILIPEMIGCVKIKNPNYPTDKTKDYPALLEIAKLICDGEKIKLEPGNRECLLRIIPLWDTILSHVVQDNHFKKYSLSQISKHFQSIVLSIQNGSGKTNTGKATGSGIDQAFAQFYQ